MNILVTGAEGYIGSVLTRFLVRSGFDVTGLDTGYFADRSLYPAASIPVVDRDIRQVTPEDLAGADAIVHLAELSNDPLGQIRPEVTRDINHQGSIRLARLAKEAGIRKFVYASSCSVYGVGLEPVVDESSPVNPLTEYAKCKITTERELLEMAGADFSPTILRNATVYGPSPRMRFDTVLNNLTGLGWTQGRIVIASDGTPWRPLIHVLDVCRGITRVLESDDVAVHARIYNLGETSENYRVRELAACVSAHLPGCDTVIEGRDRDNRSYRVRFDRIREDLGFTCTKTISDGVTELIDLFREISLTAEEFGFRSYTRMRQIEHLLDKGQLDAHFYWRQHHGMMGSAPDAST